MLMNSVPEPIFNRKREILALMAGIFTVTAAHLFTDGFIEFGLVSSFGIFITVYFLPGGIARGSHYWIAVALIAVFLGIIDYQPTVIPDYMISVIRIYHP